MRIAPTADGRSVERWTAYSGSSRHFQNTGHHPDRPGGADLDSRIPGRRLHRTYLGFLVEAQQQFIGIGLIHGGAPSTNE